MIDFKKYNRLFVFGCSFTHYSWPTWADLLAKEMEHAEYHNFGKSGSGNLLISNRVTQANCKFKFCETDLVIVMWSSAFREDRYIDDNWRTAGNIYTQKHAYDKNFVKNYTDPEGFVIRDMSLIELTRGYLNNLPCTAIHTSMTKLTGENEDLMPDRSQEPISFEQKINDIYKTTLDGMLPSVTEIISSTKTWHWKDKDGNTYYESHPTTMDYCNYLQAVGIPLSQSTIDYAIEAMAKLDTVVCVDDLKELFPKITSTNNAFLAGLF
jgi:hypothetical protein